MSPIIFLFGSLMLFGNPDVRMDTARGEIGTIFFSGVSKSSKKRIIDGNATGLEQSIYATGWGASLVGDYRDETPVRHTIAVQRYDTGSWRLDYFSLGLDYVLQWPKLPVQLAVGGEVGSARLEPYSYSQMETGKEQLGWEIHTEALQYFVLRDQLMQAFLRPAWRFYDFEVYVGDYTDQIYGRGFSLTGGVGISF